MKEKYYRIKFNNKLIKYRNNLNLPQNTTFGLEIEYENVLNEKIDQVLSNEKHLFCWENKEEIDIQEYNQIGKKMNGEINSPILEDNVACWKNLKKILILLKTNNAIVTEKCGVHVNIGAQTLGQNVSNWRNFFLLWILYEKEIYNFSSGEYLNVRNREDMLARITSYLKRNLSVVLGEYDDLYEYLNDISTSMFDKYNDISLYNFFDKQNMINNRIEFRLPNPTLREEILQNYINFFSKFLISCKKELDIDKTLYKIKNDNHSEIELADYVFDNNLDKKNFLIQSLKTNKVYKKQLQPHIYCYFDNK